MTSIHPTRLSIILTLLSMLPLVSPAWNLFDQTLMNGHRPRPDLNGNWQFRIDLEDVGVEKKWFESDTAFPGTMTVPEESNAVAEVGKCREFPRELLESA